MHRKIFISLAVGLVAIGFVSGVRADTWALPKKEKYYSPNKQYYLEVTPKKLEGQLQYFSDKVDGKEDAGADKGVKNNRAKGAFYARRDDGGYTRRWQVPLVNEVSPVRVVVSNRGDYVVTFDNWHSMGYGDDVVVIYGARGELIKKFGLADLLTEGDIQTLPRSVSSIWWGRGHYIDEAKGVLVLKVVSSGMNPHDEEANFREVKIELATGRPLEPKRDLLPQPQMVGSVEAIQAPAISVAAKDKPRCTATEASFDSTEAVRLSPEQISAGVKARPFPPYPAIAKAARASGTVVVEVLISKAGGVLCARSISGHPLLRQAAVAAALNWEFKPFEVSGDASSVVVGTIAFEFKLDVKDMNPNQQPRD